MTRDDLADAFLGHSYRGGGWPRCVERLADWLRERLRDLLGH